MNGFIVPSIMGWTVYDWHGKRRDDIPIGLRGRFYKYAKKGRARAAYWRALGYPNLVKAWAGRARYCRELRERRAREAEQKRQQLDAYLESTREDL